MSSEWSQTACILCECNCGIEVQLEGRRLERMRGDRAHPATRGYTWRGMGREPSLRLWHKHVPARIEPAS
jgi:hypothetical protein